MLNSLRSLTGRRGRCLLLAAVVVAAAGLSAGPAASAAVPILGITMNHANGYLAQCETLTTAEKEQATKEGGCIDPYTGSATTFARESGQNKYMITVTNSGEEKTSGPVTVVDQLPEGMVLGGFSALRLFNLTGWKCTVEAGAGGVSAGAVKCSNSGVLAPLASYKPITLLVLVKPQAVNPSINTATVSGGGASPVASAPHEGETTVTPAVPFGIAQFATTVFNQPKEPLTEPLKELFGEAGGHPFAVTNEIVFNYTPSAESAAQGRIVAAGGGAKEVQAELPPGFVGNPQNAPLCPVEALRNNKCPANTAVGYAQVTLNTSIIKGKAVPFQDPGLAKASKISSLVYNLAPAPGSPAEFGFLIAAGVPFVFDAKLRSDGDYGVTVGDSAVGEKPVATRVTFCENGATGEGNPTFSCNPVPANAKPFLTNLTQCPSAPIWTLRASPWYEPNSSVSRATGQNPAVECVRSLPFNPGIELKPSPASEGGTSQADEPTGITFNLNLPQTNRASEPATPALKNVTMTLPAGMTVSPSAADGLQACSNAQFGLGTEFGPGSKHSEPANPASCPTESQVGAVEVFTPLLSGAPTIEGLPGIGDELTCSQGMWSNGPWSLSPKQLEAGVEEVENGNHERLKLSYRWLREGSEVAATTKEYVPQEGDKNKPLECQVTAKNEGGSSVAVSRPVVAIPGGKREASTLPPPVPPPSIATPSGTASAGNALTCDGGAWTGEPKEPFAYQWLRNGVAIEGATAVSYVLTSADAGKVVQCQLTGTNGGGGVIADSAAVVASPLASPPPPLPGAALQGQLFVAEPECSPCTNEDAEDGKLFRLFLQVQNPKDGVVVKLHGATFANTKTGQLTTKFLEQPQQPFELLQLKLKGGPRATLTTPQSCGPAVTTADLTPWSAPFTADANIQSPPFNVEGCSPTMFNPSFNAGTTGASATSAGGSPSFSLTFSREDREQDLSGLQVRMPLGLVGKIAGIPLCGEAEVHAAEADTGECPAASKIGTADAGAGPGTHPFFTEGNVYLTGSYKGAPFGLAVVTHAIAGPFNLGNVVVRSTINIDPHTAAVTVTSDPLPQIIDGVPLRLRKVNVSVNRSGFMVNPTNCAAQQVAATITAAQGGSANVSSPFGLAGCKGLAFHPTFTAVTNGRTSKTEGASLDVKITYPPGAYANIGKSVTELPVALPSRLTTIQKACPDTTFEANPAMCGEGSVIGHAIAYTPLLAKPLAGPAYLVSHGNRAFPDIVIVLQGEGITVDLDGLTDIKKGITKTTFESLPDSPISTFELSLPQGPHSALAGNAEIPLCEQAAVYLPTVLSGQNGAVLKQNTQITVTGCSPNVKITKAKLSGNGLLVSVATASGTGTVTISGRGLKTTTKRGLAPGSHQIRVPFNKIGKSMRSHHKKATIRVSLTVAGKRPVAKSTTARL